MWKNVVRVLSIVLLVGMLVGGFDGLAAPADGTDGQDESKLSFGIVADAYADDEPKECDDGKPGC